MLDCVVATLLCGVYSPPCSWNVIVFCFQTSPTTSDVGALQKGADFVRAFILGFDVEVRLVSWRDQIPNSVDYACSSLTISCLSHSVFKENSVMTSFLLKVSLHYYYFF